MKTLLILRHAKSKQGLEYASDMDRPLSKRGKEDALRIGQALLNLGWIPEVVLSSPAKRARQTAKRVAKAAELSAEIIYDPRLYFEGVAGQLAAIRQIPDEAEIVLLVGHNPDLENLVACLTRQSAFMATATLARVTLLIPAWAETGENTGRLQAVLSPDQLPPESPITSSPTWRP